MVNELRNMPFEDWLLLLPRAAERLPEPAHGAMSKDEDLRLLVSECRQLEARETRLGIHAGTGTPIVLSRNLEMDRDLVRFFTSGRFSTYKDGTKRVYAMAIKQWCAWLEDDETLSRTWKEATEDDFYNWYRMLTNPGQPNPLKGSSFHQMHAALRSLYDWAVPRGLCERSPIPSKPVKSHDRINAVPSRDRWVTPKTLQLWRAVGIAGFDATILQDGERRWIDPADLREGRRSGAVQLRDLAYVSIMCTTGLRLRELGGLTLCELPGSDLPYDSLVPAGLAKYGKSRSFRVRPTALGPLRSYLEHERSNAVRRARKAGKYEQMLESKHLLLIRGFENRSGRWYVVPRTGELIQLDLMTADDRLRLFIVDDHGELEPAQLWLSVSGKPMPHTQWTQRFEQINHQVAKVTQGLGLSPLHAPHLSPHSLRFSFALYVLAAMHRAIDLQAGRDTPTSYNERDYMMAYDTVRDLLGHRNSQTTRDIYLEPIKGLRRALLFGAIDVQDLDDVIADLAGDSEGLIAAIGSRRGGF